MRLLLIFTILFHCAFAYQIPAPIITIYDRGFRISLKDEPGMQLVIFHGRINKELRLNEPGELHAEIEKEEVTNNRWTYTNTVRQLRLGDVIHYWIYVQHDGLGYRLESQQFVVRAYDREEQLEIVPREESLPVPQRCDQSITRVDGYNKCRNEVIFEDQFDSLDTSRWSPLVRFANENEDAEFCSYQNQADTYYIRNGTLFIQPQFQSDARYVRQGQLDFGELCTVDYPFLNNVRDCVRRAAGAYIIPPVRSARLRTRSSFKFRYGTIEIRAKMPKGDWLYPELYLEPFDKQYGATGYQSGQMRVAFVRGNDMLTDGGVHIGGDQLVAQLVLDSRQTNRHLFQRSRLLPGGTHWGDSFHTYALRWEEERIEMSVDGEPYAVFTHPLCTTECQAAVEGHKWQTDGGKLAPFDQEFFISLGVGVGGFGDFPDTARNGPTGTAKPWTNTDPRAELKFFMDSGTWYPTWLGDSTALQVAYVKVTSI